MTDRTVTYRLRAELSSFLPQMAQASASTKKLAGDLTSMEKSAVKNRQGLTTLGNAAGKFGLIAAAGLGVAIAKAATFDAAMSNVQAATHESTAAMEDLRQAALDAGAKTAFSATEAAGAIENLAKAGISTQDILAGGLDGALSLAAAGSLDVAEAAEIAATAMTQFKLEGSDTEHVADLLAAGAGKAQGSVSDLAAALKQGGLVAAQMGLSIEETTGTLAAFASAGLLGSDAGTSLKTMLLRLANPSNEASKAMTKFGIAAYDAQGSFVGIESLSEQLKTAFEGQSQATRDAALATIFGSDAIRAASVLYNEGAQGVADWTNKVNDSGYAAETAALKQDNLRGDIEKLTGALDTLLITGGDGSQGFLRGPVQGLTKFVDVLNELPAPIKNLTGGLLAITAITGGGLWFGSKVISGVANTRRALSEIGDTAPKAARGLRAVGTASAVVGGVLALDSALKALNDTLEDSVPSGQELTTRLLDLSDGKVKTLGKDFSDLAKNLQEIGTGKLFDVFKGADSIPAVSEALAGLNNVLPGETAQEQFRGFKDQLVALDTALTGLVASGGPEQAKETFAALSDSMNLTAHGQKELLAGLPGYTDALAGAANETRIAATATEDLGAVSGPTAEQQEALAKALADSREAANDTATSFFNLTGSVNDNKVSLSSWIDDMRNSALALRDFRKNANEAADRGLRDGLIAALQEAGPEGALRMKQLADATDAEIKKANQAWRLGQREIEKYVNKVGGVPADKSTTLHLNTEAAAAEFRAFIANRSDSVVYYRMVPRGEKIARAQGGPVYGPGTATSDSIPASLSNGEWVMRAAAVDKYGPQLMADINAMRFAEGGFVGERHGARSTTTNTTNHTSSVVSVVPSREFVDAVAAAIRSGQAGGGSFDTSTRRRT